MDSYSTHEQKITEIFSSIAGDYDKANDRISFGLHRLWKKRLCRIACAELKANTKVLDICCGTGDIAISLAKSLPNCQVIGLDLTSSMLGIAQKRSAGIVNLSFVQGDAMALPFPECSFDLVTIAFGLRNLLDVSAAANEACSKLKIGGRILILESGVPENKLIRAGFCLYIAWIMPLLGGGICHRKAYAWLNESTMNFPAKSRMKELLKDAGLKDVDCLPMLLGAAAIYTGTKE